MPNVERMSFRKFIAIAVCVFIIPLALLAFGAARSGNFAARLAEPGLLLGNWLYIAAPQLLALLIAAAVRSARQCFLPWALIALSLVLVVFQCWVWWWVPRRESGLVWVLYFPLCAVVLVSAAVIALWRRRFVRCSAKQTPDRAAQVRR